MLAHDLFLCELLTCELALLEDNTLVAAKIWLCFFALLNNSIRSCEWGVVTTLVCSTGFNVILIVSPL